MLLEHLISLVHCTYLSDLRSSYISPRQIHDALCEICSDAYPVEQWNDAVSYLLHENKGFDTATQAKEYLLNCLDEK